METRNKTRPLASIVILAKNEGQNIGKCLKNLFIQRLNDFEIILIDSGSTDNTLEVASRFPINIFRISDREFHHAQTRNLGVSLSRGKYIVFLTADAYPVNSLWLERLLKPFEKEEIAATYSRQIPREQTNPVEKAFLLQTYPRNNKQNMVRRGGGWSPEDFVLLSDVSSAYRRELVHFDGSIRYCEDQEMALRLLQAGYCVFYVPESVVCHSHNYSIVSLAKRYHAVGKATGKFSRNGFHPINSLRYAVKLFASSLGYVIADNCPRKRTFWFFYSIFYNSTKIFWFVFGYLASKLNSEKKVFT